MLAEQQSLKARVGCETLPANGVQARLAVGLSIQRPSSSCCAALSDSESARLGYGEAWLQFSGILDPDLFGCSCELELTVYPPASMGGSLGRNPEVPGQVGSKQNLGQPKDKSEILQGSSSPELFGSCQFLVLLLSCEFFV